MAEKTRNLRVKKQGILGSKSKVCPGTGKKTPHPCASSTFYRLMGETGCNAVKCIDLWALKRKQLLMNIGWAPS